jgi:hypothetical protein
MGIYLGQLPPAEVARLKAELAETIIANFCYPRFFDNRTNSLRMRPVDRTKREEVWLYISSFDFTTWSRVDLMSQDFQNHIERLFIQFVQRNRSFFGEQGRKRMADVRALLNTSSSSVVQGLRNHLAAHPKQGKSTFGSPHAVASWTTQSANDHAEPGWEQISAATMLLQQQLQEIRGEISSSPVPAEGKSSTNGAMRRSTISQALVNLAGGLSSEEIPQAPTVSTPAVSPVNRPVIPASTNGKSGPLVNPAASIEVPVQKRQAQTPISVAEQASKGNSIGTVVPPTDPAVAPRRGEQPKSTTRPANAATVTPAPVKPMPAPSSSPASTPVQAMPKSAAAPSRNVSQTLAAASEVTNGQREMLTIGEDDIAIFEQLRHQMLLWLRIEAIRAGLEIAGHNPPQLLELLRQQARVDETRLQVVSTLLNLSNQVIKTGLVSILDYKQALMFHLMHTRNN